MCRYEKAFVLKMSEVLDRFPSEKIELDIDYNLTTMIELKVKDADNITVFLTLTRKDIFEINMVQSKYYPKIQSYLMDEPKERLKKLKYHTGVTPEDIINYIVKYLEEHEVSYEVGKERPIKAYDVMNKYYANKYTYLHGDEDITHLFIESENYAGVLGTVDGTIVEREG